jgi:hypothetical protein
MGIPENMTTKVTMIKISPRRKIDIIKPPLNEPVNVGAFAKIVVGKAVASPQS